MIKSLPSLLLSSQTSSPVILVAANGARGGGGAWARGSKAPKLPRIQGSPYPGVARGRFGALPLRALKSQGIVFN